MILALALVEVKPAALALPLPTWTGPTDLDAYEPTLEEADEAAELLNDDFGPLPSNDELNQLAGESFALTLQTAGILAW